MNTTDIAGYPALFVVERVLTTVYLAAGFGILHVFQNGQFQYVPPFLYDLRAMFCSAKQSLLLSVGLFLNTDCSRSWLAGASLLVYSVHVSACMPPLSIYDPEPRRGLWYRRAVLLVNELIFVSQMIILYASPVNNWNLLAFFQVGIGFSLFWLSFFERIIFDYIISYPELPPLGTIPTNVLNSITAPDLLSRILQWWGFALLAGNWSAYGYAYLVTCFCIANACTRHKDLQNRDPALIGNRAALLPIFRVQN